MYQIEYTEDLQTKQLAWARLVKIQRSSAQWFLKIFLAVIMAVWAVQDLVRIVQTFAEYGPLVIFSIWLLICRAAVSLALIGLLFWQTFGRAEKMKKEYLKETPGKRRLVLSEQILRIYDENNQQILGIHWNNNIHVVRLDQCAIVCYGQHKCIAVIPKKDLDGQGGAEQLCQAVQEIQKNAVPINETIWRALLIQRPNMIWAASYDLGTFLKKCRNRNILVLFFCVNVYYFIMTGINAMSLIIMSFLNILFVVSFVVQKKRIKQKFQQMGLPMGVDEITARCELYEEGMQISRGEEGSFWEWKKVSGIKVKRNYVVIQKGMGVITAIPVESFASPEEQQMVMAFINSHLKGSQTKSEATVE